MSNSIEDNMVRDLVIEHLDSDIEYLTIAETLEGRDYYEDLDEEEFDALVRQVHAKATSILNKISEEWKENA